MRALMRERARWLSGKGIVFEANSDLSASKSCSTYHLFFGCRHELKDFLYEKEWKDRLSSGELDGLHTAFSRDQEKKVYVQERLREQAALIWKALRDDDGTIIVAGGSKMATDVRNTIVEIISAGAKCTKVEAEKAIRVLERNRRFQTESWS